MEDPKNRSYILIVEDDATDKPGFTQIFGSTLNLAALLARLMSDKELTLPRKLAEAMCEALKDSNESAKP